MTHSFHIDHLKTGDWLFVSRHQQISKPVLKCSNTNQLGIGRDRGRSAGRVQPIQYPLSAPQQHKGQAAGGYQPAKSERAIALHPFRCDCRRGYPWAGEICKYNLCARLRRQKLHGGGIGLWKSVASRAPVIDHPIADELPDDQ